MEERATAGYVFIGTAVRYLMDCGGDESMHGQHGIVANVTHLQSLLSEYEFHVTSRLAAPLWSMRDGWIVEATDHDGDWARDRRLSDEERVDLNRVAGNIRETMIAEAEGQVTFVASDKRFTVSRLTSDIGSLMANGTFYSLPDIAKFDFEEGGRALAFDLYTASAFHFLRGTEATLRDFYGRVVRRQRVPEPRMWAGMLNDMRGKRNAPSALVLDNLDSLRQHFRNPTQHPEKRYDSEEAQDLLALAIDSVNRMVRHLLDKGL